MIRVDCNEFRSKLDAYIDDELSREDRAAMLTHAQKCKACKTELSYATMLNGIMADMEKETVPPLEVQAAWRGAIRSESKSRNMRRLYKALGALAAAFVLFIGCAAVLRTQTPVDPVPTADADQGGVFTFVAADGSDQTVRSMSVSQDESVGIVTASARLISPDISASSDAVLGLVGDFGGYVGANSVNASTAYITAYVPSKDLSAFMESLEYVGAVDYSRINGDGEGMASVAITIKSK